VSRDIIGIYLEYCKHILVYKYENYARILNQTGDRLGPMLLCIT